METAPEEKLGRVYDLRLLALDNVGDDLVPLPSARVYCHLVVSPGLTASW